MNINPISPFSGKPMNDCEERELDAWCANLLGLKLYSFVPNYWERMEIVNGRESKPLPFYGIDWADTGTLMKHEKWPELWSLVKVASDRWYITICYDDCTDLLSASTPQIAIRNAWIICMENRHAS